MYTLTREYWVLLNTLCFNLLEKLCDSYSLDYAVTFKKLGDIIVTHNVSRRKEKIVYVGT